MNHGPLRRDGLTRTGLDRFRCLGWTQAPPVLFVFCPAAWRARVCVFERLVFRVMKVSVTPGTASQPTRGSSEKAREVVGRMYFPSLPPLPLGELWVIPYIYAAAASYPPQLLYLTAQVSGLSDLAARRVCMPALWLLFQRQKALLTASASARQTVAGVVSGFIPRVWEPSGWLPRATILPARLMPRTGPVSEAVQRERAALRRRSCTTAMSTPVGYRSVGQRPLACRSGCVEFCA